MEHTSAQLRLTALDHYRRLIALLYREIGVLKYSIHEALWRKANRGDRLFEPAVRKQRAKELYRLTLVESVPEQIASIYLRQTRLNLADIHQAFADGKWQSYGGRYSDGGPRWRAIADATTRLGATIERADWNVVAQLLTAVRTFQHNNGFIIEKCPQLD